MWYIYQWCVNPNICLISYEYLNIWVDKDCKNVQEPAHFHLYSQDFARIHNLVAVGPMSITNTDGIILKPLHLEFISFDWYIWLRWGSHLYSSGFQVFSIYYYPVPSQIRWIVGEKFWGDEKMTEKIKGTPPGRSYYNYQGVTRTLIWWEGTITPRQLIKVYIP